MKEIDEPLFMVVDTECDEYRETIIKAQDSLEYFEQRISDIQKEWVGCVKIFALESPESEEGVYIWLANPIFEDDFCTAYIFELPKKFVDLKENQWLKFHKEEITDWYLLSDSGEMEGGFSLRYQRGSLPPEKQSEYDNSISVKKYKKLP